VAQGRALTELGWRLGQSKAVGADIDPLLPSARLGIRAERDPDGLAPSGRVELGGVECLSPPRLRERLAGNGWPRHADHSHGERSVANPRSRDAEQHGAPVVGCREPSRFWDCPAPRNGRPLQKPETMSWTFVAVRVSALVSAQATPGRCGPPGRAADVDGDRGIGPRPDDDLSGGSRAFRAQAPPAGAHLRAGARSGNILGGLVG